MLTVNQPISLLALAKEYGPDANTVSNIDLLIPIRRLWCVCAASRRVLVYNVSSTLPRASTPGGSSTAAPVEIEYHVGLLQTHLKEISAIAVAAGTNNIVTIGKDGLVHLFEVR